GYGQPLLDDPTSKTLGSNVVLAQSYAPVELKTKATKQFVADLKKVGYDGVPDFGVYTGYVDCDLAILGLQHAGHAPTRQGFIDGLHQLGQFNPGGGLGCVNIDISLEHYGQAPPSNCSWFVKIENGKFVVFKPKNGATFWTGKLLDTNRPAGSS